MFATFPVVGRIGLRDIDPILFSFVRMAGAALILVALERLIVRSPLPPRAELGRLAVYSFFGISLNQTLFLIGLSMSSATNAAVIIATIPVLTYGVALVGRRETLAWRRGLGIAVALAGVLVILDPRAFTLENDAMVGNVLLALNSLSYSVYLVISRPILGRLKPLTVTTWLFVFGALSLAPVAWLFGDKGDLAQFRGPLGWLMLYVILGPTVGTYTLNLVALSRLSSSTVAAFIYLQPVATVVLAAVVLDEVVTSLHVVAAALVFAGVALVTMWTGSGDKRRYVPAE